MEVISNNFRWQRTVTKNFLAITVCVLSIFVNVMGQAGPPGPSSPLYGARPESGTTSNGLPTALKDVKIEQKLNQQLPLDLQFNDENGTPVKLGQFFHEKPVVISLVYYDCPMLCTQVLNGMVTSFRVLPFQIGKEYDVVTISFDPRETPTLASAKKKIYVDFLPAKMRSDASNGSVSYTHLRAHETPEHLV